MPIVYSTDDAYARERRKWESERTEFGPAGRTYVHQDYPLMVYRATHPPQGGPPHLDYEIAADENQERALAHRGFVRGADHAIEVLEAQDREFAKLAAEREREKHRLSAKAVAEVEHIEDATSNHLPTIPEQQQRRLTDEEKRERQREAARRWRAKRAAKGAE